MKQLFLATLIILGLSACSSPTYIPPNVSVGGIEHPTNFEHALVARYNTVSEHENDDKTIDLRAQYKGLKYAPRQSEFAGYEGWDVFTVPKSDSSLNEWLYLELNRDARVAVVWGNSAGWLRGWQQAGQLEGKSVYLKDVSKGQLRLGSPGEDKGSYTLLISEKGGVASQSPQLPSGITQTPEPNETCPSWVHNLYLTESHNGSMSPTWHPQIDPVYWCNFGHEHGADPKLIGYEAAFRYVADQNNLQNEQHEGFKGYAIRDEESGLGWYVNVHSTTSAISRICARHHTTVLAVTDLKTGEVLAELGFKGDFGSAKTTAEINGEHRVLQPTFNPNCGNQASIDAETSATKMVRVHNEDGISSGGYERWRGGLTGSASSQLGISFRGSTGLSIDIQNPITACNTFSCNYGVTTGSNGTRRAFRLSQLQLKHSDVKILDGADGNVDGIFYTNQYGDQLLKEGDEGAIRQYIKPGLDVTINGGFNTEDAWRAIYTGGGHATDFELEGSLGDTN